MQSTVLMEAKWEGACTSCTSLHGAYLRADTPSGRARDTRVVSVVLAGFDVGAGPSQLLL